MRTSGTGTTRSLRRTSEPLHKSPSGGEPGPLGVLVRGFTRPAGPRPAPVSLRAGFTLLELLATVAVIALMMGLVLPNLGIAKRSALTRNARELASTLEMARQRATMTGRAHRVLIGVERGSYRLEWFVSENEALGPQNEVEPSGVDNAGPGAEPISLSPPRDRTVEFRPIPSRLGRDEWLDDDFHFDGVETPEGWLDSGEVGVVFQDDGSTDAAQIVISDAEDERIVLDILPYLEIVRIRHEAI